MNYYIAQAVGILATIGCLSIPVFKKKWQMLVMVATVNTLFVVNLLLLGQVSSGIAVHVVAVLQCLVTLWRIHKGSATPLWENAVFLMVYLFAGILSYKTPLDLLPIVGSMFNMLSTFQRDEQKSRVLLLINAAAFTAYYAFLGSTSALAEAGVMVTSIIALIGYRKKTTAKEI